MLVIPAIDLRRGKSVRLTQGRKDSVTVYADDPVEIAETFVRDGAQLLHVVDLDAAFSESNSLNREVLNKIIRATNIPVMLGGGLRSTRDVEQAVNLGVAGVVVGTVAVESPETFADMLREFGAARIVVGIDAKHGQVVTHGWETLQRVDALTLSRRVAAAGVERIIYTDVGRDGMLTGVNIDQTCRIAEASGLKVIASGGVSSLEDIERLAAVSSCGIDSVIVGKALYEGRFTLAEAVSIAGNCL
jgi:phosphoribosylformimino-5-aminoimidazole carboxamide ribotide isomerase